MPQINICQPQIEVLRPCLYRNITNSNSYRIFCNDYNIGTEARYVLPISNCNE